MMISALPRENQRLFIILSIFIIPLIAFIFILFLSKVHADDITWSQTDWRGGTSLSVVSQEVSTFSEAVNINYSQNGFVTLSGKEDWHQELGDWLYRRKVSLLNTQEVLGITPEVLTDFPLSIKLEDGVNIDYSETNDDGSDIRFVDPDGEILNYEIEVWDEAGVSNAWVKIPQIDIGDQDYIWVYYGNENASDIQNSAEVWSNGYAAVWHLSQNGSGVSGEYIDSTSNAYAGMGGHGNTSKVPSLVEGIAGNAQSFDGVDDYIYIGDVLDMGKDDLTLEVWGKRDSIKTAALAGKSSYRSNPGRYSILSSSSEVVFLMQSSVNNNLRYPDTFADGDWHYYVYRADRDGLLEGIVDFSTSASGNISGDENYNMQNSDVFLIGDYQNSSGTDSHGGYVWNGSIDEVWVSNISRSNAWLKAVQTSISTDDYLSYLEVESKFAQNGYLVSNIFDALFPSDWKTISFETSGEGVAILARTFNDPGASDAPDWNTCEVLNNGEDIATTTCVNNSDRYFQYRVNLNLVGVFPASMEHISISYSSSDQVAPVLNATSISLANGALDGDWQKEKPRIYWNAGQDDAQGNGLLGYCISLDEAVIDGDSHHLDPRLSSGKLSSLDDGISSNACPYIVTGEELDLSTFTELSLNSNSKYYLSIKAVDIAGNVWSGSTEQFQDLISFKYDKTRPTSVMYISTPTMNFGSIDDMFFNWPTSGIASAKDDESGILGWQYSINDPSGNEWMGTQYDEKFSVSYIPFDSGLDMINFSQELDGEKFIVGNNTIYFRSIDNAGNVSTYVTGGINYGGEAPSFPAEAVVEITPGESTENMFTLSWLDAIPAEGKVIEYYYYMVNVTPPVNISTLRSNSNVYRPLNETSVIQSVLTGSVKGSNTIYVVAVDNEGNYSPTKAIQGSYTLNSTLPDAPLNLSIADLSVKKSKLWRTALTWDSPEYLGNGDITYLIERSTNLDTWTEIATTRGLSYTDTVPESREYYYRVATFDSSDESRTNPTYSIPLSLIPKGRFEEPASMISESVVSDVTTHTAKINWVTDRISDSKLQIGLSSGEYFEDEMYRSELVASHEISITNLRPGTRYYYRVKWTDEDGNTGVSAEKTFKTLDAPEVVNIGVRNIGLNFALLNIKTVNAYQIKIYYGKSLNYGGSVELNTSPTESEYSLMLTELEDGSLYNYKIVLLDGDGYEYEFENHELITPPRPQISNIQVQEKKEVASPTVEVFWITNTETTSILTFRTTNGSQTKDKIDMTMIKGEHKMEISGLQPDSGYQLVVEGVDVMGNKAVSDIYTFTTATDTRPPKIYNIRSEGDVQSRDVQSDRARSGQLVISWETDEPSTSQVFYGEGASGDGYPYSTQTDAELRSKHVVVISNLAPSKVYHFKVVSKDIANNSGESGSVTAITPKSSDTVVESVLGSLSRIFGFLQ